MDKLFIYLITVRLLTLLMFMSHCIESVHFAIADEQGENVAGGSAAGSEADTSVANEWARLEGTWIGTSYDYQGKTGLKLGKRDKASVKFYTSTSKTGKFAEYNMIDFWMGTIRAVGFNNPMNGTWGQKSDCEIDISKFPHRIVFPDNNPDGSDILYSLEGDTLMCLLRPHGKGERSLETKPGQHRIVLRFQRQESGAKRDSRGALSEHDLFGRWVGVSYERNGEPPRQFRGRQKAEFVLGKKGHSYTLVLGPNLQVKQNSGGTSDECAVDLTSNPMKYFHLSGDPKDEPHLSAIFNLKKDRLTWCWVGGEALLEGERPPLKLTTIKDHPRTVVHFKRTTKKVSSTELVD